jgi:cathepsin L
MGNKPTKEIFKVFHKLHKKDYPLNSEEGLKRYKIFKQNMKWNKEQNTKLGKQLYGITPFMDITDEEFKKRHLMDPVEMQKHLGTSSNKKTFQTKSSDKLTETPQIDWRSLYSENPCKKQGSCGSCWSFATNAAIEANYKKNFGGIKDLSVQYLVDCDLDDGGCNGGWPTTTLSWIMNNGVLDRSLSEYKESRTLCQYGKFEKHRQNLVEGFEHCQIDPENKSIACDREKWINLLSKGPLVVGIDASFEGFSRYKPSADKFEPVIPNYCGQINHAIVAVGLITENGEDYLIARNSWGTNWGKDGYFKISTKNHCHIMDYAWYPKVQQDKPFPPPNCPLFASECDYKGQTVNSCTGVKDFQATIGGNLKSFKNDSGKTNYFNFYIEKDCLGTPVWNFDNHIPCLKDNIFFKGMEVKSASSDSLSSPWGCIQHFSESCYSGERTVICSSIPDLSQTDFVFTSGSLYMSKYQIKNLIFFDDVKFTGNGYGIKAKEFVNLNDEHLISIMARAKSVLINARSPNDPYDPNW